MGAWDRDLIEGRHPTFRPESALLVEDTRGKSIVSSMVLLSHTWTYAGVPLSVGQPEIVGTRAEFRGRGLVRAMFDVAHAWSAERGHRLLAINGIPWFYRQFGYEMALELGGGWRVVARRRPPRARVPVRDGRSVRARGKGRPRPARLLAARQRAPVRRGGPVLLLAPAVRVLPPRTRPARPAPAPHARARAPAGRIAAARPHRRRSAELLSRRGAPDGRRRPHQERGGVAAAAHGGGPGLQPAVGRRAPSLRDVSRAHVPPAAVRLPVAGGAGGGVR